MVLRAYREQFRPSRGGEVAPGVTLLPLPGHTPGHSGYRLDSAGETLIVWGDTVHVPEIRDPAPPGDERIRHQRTSRGREPPPDIRLRRQGRGFWSPGATCICPASPTWFASRTVTDWSPSLGGSSFKPAPSSPSWNALARILDGSGGGLAAAGRPYVRLAARGTRANIWRARFCGGHINYETIPRTGIRNKVHVTNIAVATYLKI